MTSEQEAAVGARWLKFERSQAKQTRRPILPCDRAYVKATVDDSAINMLNELRKAGPSTAKYLAKKMAISTHQAANWMKSLYTANLVEKLFMTVRTTVDHENGIVTVKDIRHANGLRERNGVMYRVGDGEKNDVWVYQAVTK